MEWIAILSHQIALYNLSFWSLPFSPPLVDTVVYQGPLWKLGHIVKNWKLRRFELTQLGVLSYYSPAAGPAAGRGTGAGVAGNNHGIGGNGNDKGHLKGRVRLRGCHVDWYQESSGIRNEIILKKFDGYELVLRGQNAQEMGLWMSELKAFTGLELEDGKQQLFPTFATLPPSLPPSLPTPPASAPSARQEISYDESSSSLPPPPPLEYLSLSNLPIVPGIVTAVEEEEPPAESGEGDAATTTTTNLFPEEELPIPAANDSPPLTFSSTGVANTSTANEIPEFQEEEEEEEEQEGQQVTQPQESTLTSQEEQLSETQALVESSPSDTSTAPADMIGTSDPSVTSPQQQQSVDEVNALVPSPSVPTHELAKNQRGRRVSILNSSVVETAVENARWGGSDSDESDGEASSRSSSFAESSIGEGRPLSLLRSQREITYSPPASSSFGPSTATHEVTTNQQGRRVSVLNSAVLQEATASAVWGGNDSDESDGESTRGSSFSDSSFGENRPLSLRPISSTSSTGNRHGEGSSLAQRVPSPPPSPPTTVSETSNPDPTSSSSSHTFSSMFGFGFNRRRSL
jgi:hypothetical protein